jgi:hypothetical protein
LREGGGSREVKMKIGSRITGQAGARGEDFDMGYLQ